MKAPGRPSRIAPEDRPEWSNRIRQEREAKRFSQSELASLVGISQSAIADYERGRSRPPFDVANKIASALDVDLDWLITGVFQEFTQDVPKLAGDDFQIIDSSSFDAAFERMCSKLEEVVDKSKSFARLTPVQFAMFARRSWFLVLTMPPGMKIEDRVELVVSQLVILDKGLLLAHAKAADPT